MLAWEGKILEKYSGFVCSGKYLLLLIPKTINLDREGDEGGRRGSGRYVRERGKVDRERKGESMCSHMHVGISTCVCVIFVIGKRQLINVCNVTASFSLNLALQKKTFFFFF